MGYIFLVDDSKDEMNDGVLPFLFRAFIESLLFSSSSLAIRFFLIILAAASLEGI